MANAGISSGIRITLARLIAVHLHHGFECEPCPQLVCSMESKSLRSSSSSVGLVMVASISFLVICLLPKIDAIISFMAKVFICRQLCHSSCS